MTFEGYLAEQFMKEYHGDKDHYENAFDGWLENLDNGQLIEFGNLAVQRALETNIGLK